LAKKLFHEIVFRIKDILQSDFGICNSNGVVIASSDKNEIGVMYQFAIDIINSNFEYNEADEFSFKKITADQGTKYVAYIKSNDPSNRKMLDLISISVENIKLYYDEKYDKDSFVKNLIFGNILPGDVPIRAEKVKIKYDKDRIAFVIKHEKTRELNAY